MSYKESLSYLFYQLPMYQRQGPKAFKKDLKNIEKLAELLDHPERNFHSIHIAGTNGKGSTAHLISSILQASGLKVGLYTSPHYKDFRERIKINGEFIPQKEVIQFVCWFQSQDNPVEASFFEITVAMAFQYFANQQVDVAVIETGLGGRLDSTNIIQPQLAVITNIGLDHTQFLGNTLELIAVEKAGIIKYKTPVLIAKNQNETRSVFQRIALEQEAPFYLLSEAGEELIGEPNEFDIWCSKVNYPKEDSPFSLENMKTAVAVSYLLVQYEQYQITPTIVEQGLSQYRQLTHFIGRWTILSRQPLIIGDSAHNTEGIHRALIGLRQYEKKHFHIVLGFVSDKPLNEVLALFPSDADYYFAKADIPRGLDAEMLREVAAHAGLSGKSYTSVRKALAAARRRAHAQDDLIFIGGSIFVLAEVI